MVLNPCLRDVVGARFHWFALFFSCFPLWCFASCSTDAPLIIEATTEQFWRRLTRRWWRTRWRSSESHPLPLLCYSMSKRAEHGPLTARVWALVTVQTSAVDC